MKTEQSDPKLIELLLTELQAWRNGEPHTTTLQLAQTQLEIGWEAALDGWLSLDWQATQEAYWLQWCRCKSSKRWTAELIKKLWNVAWDMWEHCNDTLHNSTTHRDDIIKSKINDQVWEIFVLGLHNVPWDAFLFFQGTIKVVMGGICPSSKMQKMTPWIWHIHIWATIYEKLARITRVVNTRNSGKNSVHGSAYIFDTSKADNKCPQGPDIMAWLFHPMVQPMQKCNDIKPLGIDLIYNQWVIIIVFFRIFSLDHCQKIHIRLDYCYSVSSRLLTIKSIPY